MYSVITYGHSPSTEQQASFLAQRSAAPAATTLVEKFDIEAYSDFSAK